MRFYVYSERGESEIKPYILAEVVRDGDRTLSIASALAGPTSQITREVIQRARGLRAELHETLPNKEHAEAKIG